MARQRRENTLEFKQEAGRLGTEEGLSHVQVGADMGVNKCTIRDGCQRAEGGGPTGPGSARKTRTVEEELAQLRRENRILREYREIQKKSGGLLREGAPLTTYRFIRADEANHAVRMLCRVLQVSRSASCAWRGGQSHPGSRDDAELRVHLRAIHRRHSSRYGAPRITAELRAEGFAVNPERVARIMREEGIVGRAHRRFRGSTTESAHAQPSAPNRLKRDFTTLAPNQPRDHGVHRSGPGGTGSAPWRRAWRAPERPVLRHAPG